MKSNKIIIPIDALSVEEASKMMARFVVSQLEDLNINMGALNRHYLNASNDYYRS